MKCFSAAATVVLAAMLCGCQQKADMTPVWQIDLPATGVHMELSNTDDISFDPAYYAQTREDAFYNNLHEISAVMAEGAPVVAVANRKSLQLLSLRRKMGVGNGGNQAGIQPAREECRHGYVRDKLALNGIRHQVTDFSRRGRKIIRVVVVGQLPVGV